MNTLLRKLCKVVIPDESAVNRFLRLCPHAQLVGEQRARNFFNFSNCSPCRHCNRPPKCKWNFFPVIPNKEVKDNEQSV